MGCRVELFLTHPGARIALGGFLGCSFPVIYLKLSLSPDTLNDETAMHRYIEKPVELKLFDQPMKDDPFGAPERLISEPLADYEAERIAIKTGIQFARVTFRRPMPVTGRLKLSSEAVYLLAMTAGECAFVLPDHGRNVIRENTWTIFTTSTADIRVAGESAELFLVQCAVPVFNAMTEMADFSPGSPLLCMSCPQSLSPLFLHGESNERVAKLAHVCTAPDFSGLSGRIFAEVHCMKWIYELFLLPQLTAVEAENDYNCSIGETRCLRRVAAYLKENLAEEHSIKQLSCDFSINEFKLKRGFKSLYNNTVFGYLRECRMIRAEEMLRQDDLNILEISMAVGFDNPSHFSRLFKKRFGLLPKAYQSLHAGKRTYQMREKSPV